MQNKKCTGLRFYLNMVDGVVHDLENEQDQCRIDNIRALNSGVGFARLEAALKAGFTSCPHCVKKEDS
jgi:hypothetical protein